MKIKGKQTRKQEIDRMHFLAQVCNLVLCIYFVWDFVKLVIHIFCEIKNAFFKNGPAYAFPAAINLKIMQLFNTHVHYSQN